MKVAAPVSLLVTLAACNDSPAELFGPSTERLAQQCGVTVSELKGVKRTVGNMRPYAGSDAGKCLVIKDDSGVMVIPPEAEGSAKLSVKDQRQTVLNGIADRCGLPRTAWKLLDQDHVTLEKPAYESDTRGSCLINELFKSKLPVRLGFIAEPPESN